MSSWLKLELVRLCLICVAEVITVGLEYDFCYLLQAICPTPDPVVFCQH